MPLKTFLRHPAWRGAGLGLLCALLVWAVFRLSGPLRGLEDWLLDGCFALRGPRPTGAELVIIGIDEAYLARLDRPLAYLSPDLAAVVAHVHRQGAVAIGIDLLVPEELTDEPEIKRPGGRGDARPLGEAVLEAGNVVLAQRWDGPARRMRPPLVQWRLRAEAEPDPEGRDLGFIDLTEDDDQILRRQALLLKVPGPDGDEAAPHFALALYARARQAGFSWDEERRAVRVGEEVIPLDEEQKLRINFVGPPGSFPLLPFGEVLGAARAGRPLPELQGKVVLIGVTARDQQDYHATPYANHYAAYLSASPPGLMSGTEVHAHVLATLHDRAFITTPAWLHPLPWLLLVGAALGHALSRLRLTWGLLLALGHHFAWKAVALAAFAWFCWRVEMAAMLALGLVVTAAVFALRWRRLRRMLGVVKSEQVALALEADPRRLDPGGEQRTVTVLFADIRGFTDFAQGREPAAVVALLNGYFDAVVPVLEAEGGVIDKYMGDGLMALFGAPASCPDHALRAVRAAVGMVRAVHARQEQWARQGKPDMRIGVGVYTGEVVVGAIGSRGRLDYTAVGDTVNRAARLESANKDEETEILISAATYAALPEGVAGPLGCQAAPRVLRVRGITEEVRAHAVAATPPEPAVAAVTSG
jgi:class 3 adenylate cyclase/CHASE2 domain-containing sensor protein